MKKRFSIFWNVALSQLVVVIIAETVIMALAYATISNHTYEHCYGDIEKYAYVIEDAVSKYDLDDAQQAQQCSEELSKLCINLDAPYIYVIEVDKAQQSEKYLAIGFGEDATNEAKKTRYNGVVVTGKLKPQMFEALKDENTPKTTRVNNKFGNSLICYKKLHTDQTNTRLVGVEKTISDVVKDLNSSFALVFGLTLFFMVTIILSFSYAVYRIVSKPAREISTKMNRFVSERKEASEKIEEKGSLEFSRMAAAYNSMTNEINRYIEDIESLNREKHIREAELNIAKNIQLGLLAPDDFDNRYVNIEAYMLPAKEVGGDMYDYQVLENGEICFAVADVSGKGVSASLFMARAITLLNIYSKLGMTPAKTAEAFNNTLCENNPKKLFITAFVAKYNPETKKLTYTNVGHNPPYLISDKLITLEGAHGMAAGIFPGITYEQEEIILKADDALFVYTDGVNEAQNKDGELLTTKRLEQILAEHIDGNKKAIIKDVLKAVNDFANGALQSDDITMLTLVVNNCYGKILNLKSEVEQLTQINEVIDAIPDLSFDDKWNLKLMAEEIFVNICSYSYPGSVGDVTFKVEASDRVEITFEDSGVEYDPTKNLLDIETYDHNHTVGGLGKFITFNTADDFEYRYENGKNILKLIKNIS